MNFFKKRSTAWTIFFMAVIFSFFIGQSKAQITQPEILPGGVYVQDKADLLSETTEKYITQMNNGLVSAIGAEIQVAVIDTTDGKDIFDMAYDLAMETNLSPRCCVFLVAVDDINTVIIQGDEIMYAFSDDFLSDILNANFTVSDFENREIDFAVRSSFDELVDKYEQHYNITVKARGDIEYTPESGSSEAATIITMIILILLIILVVYIISRPKKRTVYVPVGTGRTGTTRYGRSRYPPRGSYNTPPPYSGSSSSRSGGFSSSKSSGGSFSSSSSRSSRSGGFSSSSRSSGGSFSSRSSSRSGGFGGGSRGGSFGGGSRGGGFRK